VIVKTTSKVLLLLLFIFYLSQTHWSIAKYTNTQIHIDTRTAKQPVKTVKPVEKTNDIKKTNDYLPLTCYSQAYYCNAKDYTPN